MTDLYRRKNFVFELILVTNTEQRMSMSWFLSSCFLEAGADYVTKMTNTSVTFAFESEVLWYMTTQ